MSTQTKYPKQATKRTLASLLVALTFAVFLLTMAHDVVQVINEDLGAHLPEKFITSSSAVAAVCIAIATAITRIMAIPSVNSFLTKVGLGAEPKKAQEEMEEVLAGQLEPYNIPSITIDDTPEVEVLIKETPVEIKSPLSEDELRGRG